jgi:hypothetical protein
MADSDDRAVAEFLATLDEATRADALALDALMRRVSGFSPTLWNAGTLGYGLYHYKYATGREGDGHIIGFYPRRGKITVYLMDGTARHAALLASLGPHSLTGYCVYLKRVSDVDLDVLERIVRSSFEYISGLAAQGPIREILWKAEA